MGFTIGTIFYDTGVSEYNNEEVLHKFAATIKDDQVWVDGAEIATLASMTGIKYAGVVPV